MNCKPGDLARVVENRYGHYGKIVRVLHADPDPRFAARFWVVDPPLSNPMFEGLVDFVSVLDAYLRPIGDPPEEAVDEMVQLLGVSPTLEPA